MNHSEAMHQTPIDIETVDRLKRESGIANVGKSSIRELVKLVVQIEKATNSQFVKMEMGVPGLATPAIAIEAEIEALRSGVTAVYPSIEGIDPLKKEMSRFVKNFLNVEVREEGCIPTVGSMQGGMAAFMVANRCDKAKDTVLFIDPGFPVQKNQLRMLGMKYETFDVYNYRGEKLRSKLEKYLQEGNISCIIYSNPNNPTWVCLTEKELQIIGDLATRYDVVVVEDLAYFAMDFRVDMSKPGVPPYQPTVAKYTDNYLMLISGSKAFSYAGQRIGCVVISDVLFKRRFPDLKRFFPNDEFGKAMIFGPIYGLSSGVAHSVQYGFAALLKAVNDGKYNFVEETREYGEKAKILKQIFEQNGFHIVYDRDEDKVLADGFYFTVGYQNLTGEELLEELLYYGVSAISLSTTGSKREGIRACVSQVARSQFGILEERLKMFNENHKVDKAVAQSTAL
ncbi:aspartate/methionine/tyrosine aminotransferase [Acetobacteroides hydrogenigenes]|uniref:Aspartate/methionine/tyrosine aminotransferase n=2 Tax=Acetobacteroides hydrogenigenes TaxID=979970 RepID=A0A4R2EA51_9BACT|nr:pyridoxal phosphate-dependent aminotransferase [Acetobacteroides hydrogenigenes]TCN64725.1 aspartate/methionine/tyrosine aminotransferase [Acetobacteroides hydrogenigenes]